MAKQIRQSVFETNSSSSHSLTISPDETRDLGLISEALKSGVLTVKVNRSYGGEWGRLYRPESKIAYLISQAAGRSLYEASGKRNACEIVRKASPQVDGMISAVESLTGCSVVLDVDGDYFGVNHRSSGVGTELFQDEEALLNFIFCKDTFVQLGNDNDSAPEMVSTDLGSEVPMYGYLYRDSGTALEGTEVCLEVGVFHEEVMLTVGEEVLYAKANLDASWEISDALADFAITEISARLIQPVRDWENGPERWKDPAFLQERARNGLVGLLSGLGEEGAVNFPRDIVLEISVDQKNTTRQSAPEPFFTLKGFCSPVTVDALRECLQDIEAARLRNAGP